ncbi:MAG TPA: hypothetical protein PLN85_01885 [archaeon]|nr:hypothetical protein [archaeon]HRT02728.1 hypothetical protein [Candidatus Diapherotrites archaeon]
MNKPYVKQYDNNGVLINPIETSYTSKFPNREYRRRKLPRFTKNSKSYHLTINKMGKFHRNIQVITCKDGSVKRIMHYTQSL